MNTNDIIETLKEVIEVVDDETAAYLNRACISINTLQEYQTRIMLNIMPT